MATKIIIKNSAVEGKVPDGTAIDAAELAINLKDQKLYSKDADGNVFDPIGAGANVPGGDNPPGSGNEIGDLFFDTTLNQLLYWDGSAWVPVSGDDGPLELSAELNISATPNAQIEWGTTVRAIATVFGGIQPVRLTYQWWNDFGAIISDTEIFGATNASYELPENKIGYSIWCRVKATDAEGTELEVETNKCSVINKVVSAELWTEDSGKLYPTTLTNDVQVGGTAADPNITLNASDGTEFAGNSSKCSE